MTDTKQATYTPEITCPHMTCAEVDSLIIERDRLRAERDDLVEALEQCAGELESEFTGIGGKDLSGGLVPRVRALLSRLERP